MSNRYGRNSAPVIPSRPPGVLEEAQFWHRNDMAKSWDLMQGLPAWRPGDPKELFFPAPVLIKRIYDNGDVRTWDFKKQVETRRARLAGKDQEIAGFSYKDIAKPSTPPVPPRQYKDSDVEDAEFESLNTEEHEVAVEIPTENETEVIFA